MFDIHGPEARQGAVAAKLAPLAELQHPRSALGRQAPLSIARRGGRARSRPCPHRSMKHAMRQRILKDSMYAAHSLSFLLVTGAVAVVFIAALIIDSV